MCRGRSHYKYRMAILVTNMEDLINKLQFTTCNTIENINKEWFFYGSHHIVPENKKNRDNGDITTFEKKALTHQAK